MKANIYIFILVFNWFLNAGCYSFKGISIPPAVKTYYVNPVNLNALDAPNNLPETFREAFRLKVRQQSGLVWNDSEPDVEFFFTINNYLITTEAAGQGSIVSLNKLTISISGEYINHKIEDDGWKKNFSGNFPFDPNEDFSANQEAYVTDILEQINEQIFNEAFAQW